MAGVKLSLLWSADGCQEKLYPQWGEKRLHKPPEKKIVEIPSSKIVEVESIQVATLKYLVRAKKESLEATRVHARKLYSQNIALMDKILRAEDKTHAITDKILGRYEHYKGAIAKLKMKSSESIIEAERDKSEVQIKLQDEIDKLRSKIQTLNDEVVHDSNELQVMRHYKENEFPVQVAKIEQLKDRLTDERAEQEERLVFLQKSMVEQTMQDIQHQSKRIEDRAVKQATQIYLENTKKSVETKAIQNELIRKEIRMHQEERNTLIGQIEQLKNSIAEKKSLLRRQAFTRCEPDTEYTLDIPMFEPLPV